MKGPPRRGERGGFFYFRTIGVAIPGHRLLFIHHNKIRKKRGRTGWPGTATPTIRAKIEGAFSAPVALGDADKKHAHQLLLPLPHP